MTMATRGTGISTMFYKPIEHYELCEINGSKFALFNKQIETEKSLNIELKDYNVVFLAPLKAKENIHIKAVSVIVLSNLKADGRIEIEASDKFIAIEAKLKSSRGHDIHAQGEIFLVDCEQDRKRMILEEFESGISERKGVTIFEALVDTFDAIADPLGENETVDNLEAIEFFNISTSSPKAVEGRNHELTG